MSNSSFVSVPTLEAFFEQPANRYVVFRNFAYWQLERRAFGTIIWGRPDENDVAQMCQAHEVGADPLFRGHTSLVDIRALESVDILAFERLLSYLRKRRDAWSANVSEQAVLHRGGYAHAVIAGMFQFLRPGHPVAFFDDPMAAYGRIGAGEAHDELESLRGELLGLPEVLRRLHAALESLPPGASCAAVARAMGTSSRSLQRRLAASGSSLRVEREKRILRACERLLEGTELDLAAVATQAGASSPARLTRLFREHHGVTPREFRAHRQKPR